MVERTAIQLTKQLPCGHRIRFCPRGDEGESGDLPHQKSQAMVEHYNELFQQVFPGFVPRRMLEIGVCRGGSLAIWKDYFECEVVGIDCRLDSVTSSCTAHFREQDGIRAIEMTMPDAKVAELGSFDLIVDDGGHGYSLSVIARPRPPQEW